MRGLVRKYIWFGGHRGRKVRHLRVVTGPSSRASGNTKPVRNLVNRGDGLPIACWKAERSASIRKQGEESKDTSSLGKEALW